MATREDGTAIRDHVPDGNKVAPATLAEVGINRKTAARAARLADVPEAAIKAEVATAQAENRLPSRTRILAHAESPPASPTPPAQRAKNKPAPSAPAAVPLRARRAYSKVVLLMADLSRIEDPHGLLAGHDPATIESDLELAHAAGERLLDLIAALEAIQRAKP